MEALLLRFDALEQAHREDIDELQVHHEKRIQTLEESHDSDIKSVRLQLAQRVKEIDSRIETFSKTVGDLSSIVNNHGTTANGSTTNSKATFEALTAKVNDPQAQLTVLNMATAQSQHQHNKASEAQGTENQALRRQITDLRREFVESTTAILAANDDFTQQVQTMSDRTMLLEQHVEHKINQLHDTVDVCRDVIDNLKEDVPEAKSRSQECAADVQVLLNYAHRTGNKIAEIQDKSNGHAQVIQTLQNGLAARASVPNLQASPFAALAATAMMTQQPFPTTRSAFGYYGFNSQPERFRFNFTG